MKNIFKRKLILCVGLFILFFSFDTKAAETEEYCIDNDWMHLYWENVQYLDSNYTYSCVEQFIDTKALKSTPKPVNIEIPKINGATVYKVIYADNPQFVNPKEKVLEKYTKSYDLYNLMPDRVYFLKLVATDINGKENVVSQKTIQTTGLIYALKIDGVTNVRDIGHKNTSFGKEVVMGRIYRGANINNIKYSGLCEMVYNEGIIVEIDFRNDKERGYDTPEITDDYVPRFTEYYNFKIGAFDSIKKGNSKGFANVFKQILMCLRSGKNVYIHCAAGADRTGAMAAILEGVLGVSESDISKDYELTSFANMARIRYFDTNYLKSNNYFPEAMAKIKTYPGERMCDKWATFLKTGGVTDSEIDEFRMIMLEN